ncbi:MAG: BMP family protein [Gemmatimonadota bacterium]|nr:BMP family protein [Gemmatimonadota bacterium]
MSKQVRLFPNRRISRLSTVVHSWFAFAILACGGTRETAKSGGPAPPVFKVALVTTGPISDQGWNAGAYAGLIQIRDSLGAVISNVQTQTPAEIDENFRQYGSQGYDLVFGHGFEYQDPAIRVAKSFPKTDFATTSGTWTAPNVAGVYFKFSAGAYLAGVVAAGASHSGVLGAIGGTQLPPVVAAFKAFEEGARSVNPNIKVLTAYVGNWDDASAAREQALAQIARGADVIFQDADAAGLGVFQAARQNGTTRVIGSNSDQNGVAPEVTLGSVVIDLPRAMMMIARDVQNRRFTGHVYQLGGIDGVVRWVPNPKLAAEISPSTRAKLDSAKTAIDSKALRVPE